VHRRPACRASLASRSVFCPQSPQQAWTDVLLAHQRDGTTELRGRGRADPLIDRDRHEVRREAFDRLQRLISAAAFPDGLEALSRRAVLLALRSSRARQSHPDRMMAVGSPDRRLGLWAASVGERLTPRTATE
jgi:hypothetical protein